MGKKGNIFSLDAFRKDRKPDEPGPEFIMFTADKPDLMGLCFDRETLEKDILQRVLKRTEILDAWMDGDDLICRVKPGSKVHPSLKRHIESESES